LCFAQGGPGGIKRFRAKASPALDAGWMRVLVREET
jgi:hypothetical protein